MTRMVYENIVVNTLDGRTVQHDWWANIEMGDQSKSDISGRVRDGWSPGPKSTALIIQVKRSMYRTPKVGCLNRWADIIENPITSYWSWSSASSARMPMTADGKQLSLDPSTYRVQAISTNPGGGHGGSEWDCSSIFSWDGAVGMSASLVVIGQSMPWDSDRDLHGWTRQLLQWLWLRSHGVGSSSLGKLTLHPIGGCRGHENFLIHKESSGSIACQSSTTFSLSDGAVHWGLAAGSSPPSTGLRWHRWGPGVAGQVGDLGCWTLGQGAAWTCTSLGMDVQAEGCSHYLHPLPNYMPLAPQMRHALIRWTPSSHYFWGPPPVLSTKLAFLLGGCTTVSTLSGARERAPGHRVP